MWQELEVPVIAAVHGAALGGGLQIALGADLRIVAPDAKLSVLEARWGLIPDMTGTVVLPKLVGLDVAKDLTFTGRMVSGEEAVAIGLATRLADDPVPRARAGGRVWSPRALDAAPGGQAPAEPLGHPPPRRAAPRRAGDHGLADRQPEPGGGHDGLLREAVAHLHLMPRSRPPRQWLLIGVAAGLLAVVLVRLAVVLLVGSVKVLLLLGGGGDRVGAPPRPPGRRRLRSRADGGAAPGPSVRRAGEGAARRDDDGVGVPDVLPDGEGTHMVASAARPAAHPSGAPASIPTRSGPVAVHGVEPGAVALGGPTELR